MKNFTDLLAEASNVAYTEKGAVSYASSLDSIVDLFSLGGASRRMTKDSRKSLIRNAIGQNTDLGIRALFYLGDVRGGAGERDMFKIGLELLAEQYPDLLIKLVDLIPEYTRWDMIYSLVGTKAEGAVVKLINRVHKEFADNPNSHLMYKWLKSVNTSSKESCKLGRWTANALGFENSYVGRHAYQKLLSLKRKQLGDAVVEVKLSSRQFNLVDYSKVPSKANLKYRKAFKRNDGERFDLFNQKVAKGEAKVNASVTNAAEILHKYKHQREFDQSLENLWEAMKKMNLTDERILPVADVSGSMDDYIGNNSTLTALTVSQAFAILSAESLTGVFKNMAIVFSAESRFIDFNKTGKSLFDRLKYIERYSDCSTTRLQSVFDLILTTALDNNVPNDQLPTKVVIISDMEFDAVENEYRGRTNLEAIKAKYAKSGYTMPQLVFWNVCARTNQLPATKFSNGVAMVSGYSNTLIDEIIKGEIVNPLTSMLKVLDKPRYRVISEVLKGE